MGRIASSAAITPAEPARGHHITYSLDTRERLAAAALSGTSDDGFARITPPPSQRPTAASSDLTTRLQRRIA